MKRITIITLAILAGAFTVSAVASHNVPGYYRHNGTYVSPHRSMDPGEARSSGYSYHNNELVYNR
jgi:hypothetical protein